eukprot:868635-Lingulodinium_polyedra.AAC.1
MWSRPYVNALVPCLARWSPNTNRSSWVTPALAAQDKTVLLRLRLDTPWTPSFSKPPRRSSSRK